MTGQAPIVRTLWVATTLGAIALVFLVASLVSEVGEGPGLIVLFAVIGMDAIAFVSMAVLIERKRPGNRVALVLAATGPLIVLAFSGFVLGAIRYVTHGREDVLGGAFAAIGAATLGPALFTAVPALALLFPDGRLPGPRWRIPFGLTLGAVVTSSLLILVRPGAVNTDLPDNPFGIDTELLATWATLVDSLLAVAVFVGAVLAVTAVATRFRRSRGLEREQVKWLLAAVTIILLTMPASFVDGEGEGGFTILDTLAVSSLALLPVSVGIAITRYRLYEIDRFVSRGLAWAVVTGLLVVLFAGSILVLQGVFAPFTGGSTLAIAASTLVAATLFQPLQARVQGAVDRRFNRARVDAQQTIDALGMELRDEVDLGALQQRLIAAVNKTVRPAASAVWIRTAVSPIDDREPAAH